MRDYDGLRSVRCFYLSQNFTGGDGDFTTRSLTLSLSPSLSLSILRNATEQCISILIALTHAHCKYLLFSAQMELTMSCRDWVDESNRHKRFECKFYRSNFLLSICFTGYRWATVVPAVCARLCVRTESAKRRIHLLLFIYFFFTVPIAIKCIFLLRFLLFVSVFVA